MLVLSRQRDETIMIGDEVEVTVVDIRGDKVRLGISAPRHVTVHRKEVYDAIKRENQAAAQVRPEDLPKGPGPSGPASLATPAPKKPGTDGPERPVLRAAVPPPPSGPRGSDAGAGERGSRSRRTGGKQGGRNRDEAPPAPPPPADEGDAPA